MVKLHIVSSGRNTRSFVARYFEGLIGQTLSRTRWRGTWIDDASDDNTREALQTVSIPGNVALVFRGERMGGLVNQIHAIQESADDEVIVIWDADDFFATPTALSRIAREFEDPDVWFTYGSFVLHESDLETPVAPGTFDNWGAYPDDVVRRNAFRSVKWRCAHPKAFRAWLFRHLDADDLLDDDGSAWSAAYDQALCLPLLELSGRHSRHIADTLYVYNVHSRCIRSTRSAEQEASALRVRARAPKSPLVPVRS